MNQLEVFGASAAVVAVVMVATWVVSLAKRDVSIVDVVWGLGFVAVGWTSYLAGEGTESRRLLLAGMVTLWGGRLALHLFLRNKGRGEDARYVAMRERRGDRFAVESLWRVFGLQGVLLWVVSLPVQVGAVADQPPSLGPVEIVGLAVYTIGIYVETFADFELNRFRADPANEGEVLDTGLWRYSRHPNYFGDFCVWWGIWIVAAATGVGVYAIVGPVVMTVLLLRVSGVTMLERTIGDRRPGYADYVERTNAFFPGPPRRRA